MRIAIFPGHCGKDTGAISKAQGVGLDLLMTIEAVINGQVAVLLKNKLDQHGIYTEIHNGSFEKRIEQSAGADLGVSLHCDAFVDPKVSGCTIWHYPDSPAGKRFSNKLGLEISNYVCPDILFRGLKESKFFILKETRFPCVLLEMGFLTNPEDEVALNLYCVQNSIAHSILCAILKR